MVSSSRGSLSGHDACVVSPVFFCHVRGVEVKVCLSNDLIGLDPQICSIALIARHVDGFPILQKYFLWDVFKQQPVFALALTQFLLRPLAL